MQKINFIKRILGKTIAIVAVFILFFALAVVCKTKAGTTDNTIGWLWANSDDGAGNNSAVGYISLNNTNSEISPAGSVSYGVNIPTADGSVTGYAWSTNVGAIDFDPQDHCGTDYTAASCSAPDGSNGGVSRSGNSLVGWARFVEIAKGSSVSNAGGWVGWIHMNGSNYSVTIDPTTGKLNGYAWSNELGAISFQGTTYAGQIQGPINGACNPLTNGQTFDNAPTTNLCSAGLATAVAGTGPWTWSCNGINGGNPANCSANKTCHPNWVANSFSCSQTPADCAAAGCGKAIQTTGLCNATDSNNCGQFPTQADCQAHGVPCADAQVQCQPCVNAGNWREVAP